MSDNSSVDLSQAPVGEDLKKGVKYAWRVTGVTCKQSKAGNLYLSIGATVIEGPSQGVTAYFPPYVFMLFDNSVPGDDPKNQTPQYLMKTTKTLGKILGEIDPRNLMSAIPTKAGARTELTERLLNATFEAGAEWNPGNEQYDGSWQIGRVIRPLAGADIQGSSINWADVFTVEMDEQEEGAY